MPVPSTSLRRRGFGQLRRWVSFVAASLAGVLLATSTVSGQLNSVPVIYAPPAEATAELPTAYLFFGHGGDDDSGENTALGATYSFGIGGSWTVTAGASALWPEDSLGKRSITGQGMAFVQYNLFYLTDSELHDLTFGPFLGAGYTDLHDGAWEVNIPIGVGGALIHNFPGIALEQWIAPRYSVRFAGREGENAWQGGVGLSAGLNVGWVYGVSLYLALDWSKRNQKTEGTVTFPQETPFVWALGVRYRF